MGYRAWRGPAGSLTGLVAYAGGTTRISDLHTPVYGWGSYTSNPSFTNAGLDADLQAPDSGASTAWGNIWSTSTIKGRSYTLQSASQALQAYEAGRQVLSAVTAAAHMAYITGNPAYTANASTAVTNMMAAQTRDDPWGAKMYDIENEDPGRDNFESMKLNEPLAFGVMSVYTRLAHENGGAPAGAIDRLKQMWRRWGDGAWSWDAIPGTYDSGYALNHATPDPYLKTFSHNMAGLALVAWNLYKMTDDPNYLAGVRVLLQYLGLGAGVEAGVTPTRGTWVHCPDETDSWGITGQSMTYLDYTLSFLSLINLEGGFAGSGTAYDIGALQRGVNYFVWRDAGVSGLRSDMAGGVSGEAQPEIVTLPLSSGGVRHEADGTYGTVFKVYGNSSPSAYTTSYEWYGTQHYVAAPQTAYMRTTAATARDTVSDYWTRSLGLAVGLGLHTVGYGLD